MKAGCSGLFLVLLAAAVLVPEAARANMWGYAFFGIATILVWWVLLVPLAFEWLVMRRWLGFGWGAALAAVVLANIFSSLIGSGLSIGAGDWMGGWFDRVMGVDFMGEEAGVWVEGQFFIAFVLATTVVSWGLETPVLIGMLPKKSNPSVVEEQARAQQVRGIWAGSLVANFGSCCLMVAIVWIGGGLDLTGPERQMPATQCRAALPKC